MIEILSPATSANLGPGFDTMGLSVKLYNSYKIRSTPGSFTYNGKPEDINNTNNLIIKSILRTYSEFNRIPEGFELNVKSNIPSARGLGSSSSCITAGVAMGFMLMNKKADKEKIFNISTEIEGHPDNVAPCIYGGATISFAIGKKEYKTVKFNIHKKYKFVAFIPNFRLATVKAREVLPKSYKKEEVVFNISRAAALPLAFERGDCSLLRYALEDKIHQPFRKELIKDYDKIFMLTEKNGFIGTYLSGAGPTVMGIYDNNADILSLKDELRYMKDWDMKFLEIDNEGLIIKTL